ncbi:MAG: DNA polymerase Y family protein [Acidimicrobiaceae bacterium]|nr:DNA polymerase Y family protein [Acidimicrobiaceae bacterium]
MAREPSLPQPQAPPERMVAVRLGASHADDWEPVAAALEQFTPEAEALRPGLHAFGARGPSRYFGGERALAELVAKAVAGAMPSASRAGVGVADGLFAAGLAAKAASASTDVLVVPPQQSQPFLVDLPLISLHDPVSPLHGDEDGAEALLDVLWRLGIRTLGDLAALSEADVLGRFGWTGLLAHRLACGLDDRPLQTEAAGEDAGAEAEIDPPADRIETVAFMARALADTMMARLDRDGLDCMSVNIEAHSDSGHASHRRWRHEFRFNAPAVVDRVRWQLEGWYRSPERPAGPITLIRIKPCAVAPANGRQLGMWGARSEADERAAKALARVQGLLGAEAVTVPRLAGGRRPADTGRRVPLHAAGDADRGQDSSATGPRNGKKKKKTKTKVVDAPWAGRLPAPSPAVVPPQPEPVVVTDCEGALVTVGGRGEASAPPQRFTDSAGRSQAVTAWAGPWPLDERWWRPSARRRQARFQLVLNDGSAHLCVLESGRWWREATYD